MMFKIGDKVTILLSSLPIYVKRNTSKTTSGVIIGDCPVLNCMVVKLDTGGTQYLFAHDMTLVIKKNLQLEFVFMKDK